MPTDACQRSEVSVVFFQTQNIQKRFPFIMRIGKKTANMRLQTARFTAEFQESDTFKCRGMEFPLLKRTKHVLKMIDNSRQIIPNPKHEIPLPDNKCQLLRALNAARTIWITLYSDAINSETYSRQILPQF